MGMGRSVVCMKVTSGGSKGQRYVLAWLKRSGRLESCEECYGGAVSGGSLDLLLEKQISPGGICGMQHTNWVLRTELEFQPEDFVHVQWVCIEDIDIQLPFLEAFRCHQLDSWR